MRGYPLATWITSASVRLAYPVCPENEICAAPIGICRHIWVALLDLFLPLSRMSCNRDAESDRIVLGEGISFVDRESLLWAKLGPPCRDLNFRKSCPRLWADRNLLMSGCRKPETYLI